MLTGGQGRYGNVDLERQVMGKNRERVRSCFSPRLKPPRQIRGRPQFIAAERITPRAATAFKIYYAVKSHLAAARRCGASRRHAGGPRLSRPYPRRVPFRSEVARRHAGGPRLSRPYPRRACSDALRRAPSSPLPEISVRNKISSIARTAIFESVIAPVIRYCGPQRTQRSQGLC